MLFKHKQHFKTTLAIYALKNLFRFRYHKHAHNYTVARCISRKCDWRIMVKQVCESQTYEVKKAHLKHICEVDVRGSYTKHATSKAIAAMLRSKYESCVRPRSKDLPAVGLKNLQSRMQTNKGVHVSSEVDSENDESWLWFFEKLVDVISDGADFTLVSDMAPSIASAKEVHYLLTHHGSCLLHIQRHVNQKFTKRRQ
ncbi:unnamed protein product [Microthlaspi erraticum]|uniref:Transposase MuDR plant domain-containing protein n=1 Tax=Microthlaspi erraticum TaxID=1685480 RepID=A0A6D2IF17_9BRAS|nr:unnamed protein product [Microthlaspi erraticum]